MSILNNILGRERVLVKENERAITLYKGEIGKVLGPGEHWLASGSGRLEVNRFDLRSPEFSSVYEKALFEKLPDQAAKHLTMVRTTRAEIAVIERDGQIHTVLGPDRRVVLWTDAGPWKTEIVRIDTALEVDRNLLTRLMLAKKTELVTVQVRIVELRRTAVDIAGQELLTKDRVTIRVNLSADYVVADPLKAVSMVANYADALYRALQFAFRKTLGALTLDQILEKKVSVDEEAAAKVRSDMAEIGIDVLEIALKDVILPGEMRDLLNQVVAAEKQAEANIIRRREETNATRSLLNTAKVMAENPVMLRLKELEALEAIAGKVERLTVHNGTGGLLNDIVKLREG